MQRLPGWWRQVVKLVIDTDRWGWLRRVRCWLTLNHIDPGVMVIGQRLCACKRCGKVWPL